MGISSRKGTLIPLETSSSPIAAVQRRAALPRRLVARSMALLGCFALGFVLPLQIFSSRHAPDSPLDTAVAPGRRLQIALLHKVHGTVTLRGLNAALLAQQQVRRAGGWYGLLYSTHPAAVPGHGITLEVLRRELGPESVFVVGTADVAAALGRPLLEQQRRVIGEKEWAWVTNDVVEITWFVTAGQAMLPAWAQHLWLLELDVGWTGDLVGTLISTVGNSSSSHSDSSSQTSSNSSSSRLKPTIAAGPATGHSSEAAAAAEQQHSRKEPDWVAFNTQKADAGWRWFAARNRLTDGEVWRSYRHAARCSRRLLRAIAAAMRSGHVQSDEAMGPSICAQHRAWCVLDTFWQPGHPAIGRDAATGEALYRWESAIGPQRWEGIVAADEAAARAYAERRQQGGGSSDGGGDSTNNGGAAEGCVPGRLYHALKW